MGGVRGVGGVEGVGRHPQRKCGHVAAQVWEGWDAEGCAAVRSLLIPRDQELAGSANATCLSCLKLSSHALSLISPHTEPHTGLPTA